MWAGGRATAAIPRAPLSPHPWVDGARHLPHQGEPMERAPKQGCFPAKETHHILWSQYWLQGQK